MLEKRAFFPSKSIYFLSAKTFIYLSPFCIAKAFGRASVIGMSVRRLRCAVCRVEIRITCSSSVIKIIKSYIDFTPLPTHNIITEYAFLFFCTAEVNT